MAEMMQEKQLLDDAMAALRLETGLELAVAHTQEIADKARYDALLIAKGFPGVEFTAEVKRWATHANFGALVYQLATLPGRPLLVADYVNPEMAARLKERGLQFIDACGNAYIDAKPAFVFVKGNKPTDRYGKPQVPAAAGVYRAFQPTGLKVVFAFLCRPDLVTQPYREIAAVADVALGTVGWVVNALLAGGYLQEGRKKGERRFTNRERLLQRWVEDYPMKLRPKLFLGHFRVGDPHWWRDFNLETYDACWGGEVAAAKYTRYLEPEVATVYLPEAKLKQLVLDARLRKEVAKRDGMQVAIYEKFWANQNDNDRRLVPPILAYADLVATGDARNLEVARTLYEQCTVGYFRED